MSRSRRRHWKASSLSALVAAVPLVCAVSLEELGVQPILVASISCRVSLQDEIPGCERTDFIQGCSRSCTRGIDTVASAVSRACAGKILGNIMAPIVSEADKLLFCGNGLLASLLGEGERSSSSSRPRPTPIATTTPAGSLPGPIATTTAGTTPGIPPGTIISSIPASSLASLVPPPAISTPGVQPLPAPKEPSTFSTLTSMIPASSSASLGPTASNSIIPIPVPVVTGTTTITTTTKPRPTSPPPDASGELPFVISVVPPLPPGVSSAPPLDSLISSMLSSMLTPLPGSPSPGQTVLPVPVPIPNPSAGTPPAPIPGQPTAPVPTNPTIPPPVATPPMNPPNTPTPPAPPPPPPPPPPTQTTGTTPSKSSPTASSTATPDMGGVTSDVPAAERAKPNAIVIGGVVTGSVAVALLISALLYFLYRRNRRKLPQRIGSWDFIDRRNGGRGSEESTMTLPPMRYFEQPSGGPLPARLSGAGSYPRRTQGTGAQLSAIISRYGGTGEAVPEMPRTAYGAYPSGPTGRQMGNTAATGAVWEDRGSLAFFDRNVGMAGGGTGGAGDGGRSTLGPGRYGFG